MGSHVGRAVAAFAVLAFVLPADEALAAGPILLTQAKALAGGITPGDAPGFPITLSKSGSYVFKSNLLPPAGVNGIEVTVPYVTIDFGGFLLHGGNAASIGITTTGNALTVKNGTIAHFKFNGIVASAFYATIEHMRVVENGNEGINLGDYASVVGSTISANGSHGIDCGYYCHIEGNVLSSNHNRGVHVVSGTILGNTIQNNTSQGILTDSNTGYGNNTLVGNNSGGDQIAGFLIRLQPNACNPACP